MAERIEYSDLFDPSINQKIKELETSIKSLGEVVNQLLNQGLKRAKTEADKLASTYEKLNKTMRANQAEELAKRTKQTADAQATARAEFDKTSASIEEMKNEVKALQVELNKQNYKSEKAKELATKIQVLKDNVNQLTASAKRNAKELNSTSNHH